VINPRRGFDSELNGLTRQFNMAHGNVIPAHVADELYSSVTRLREQRIHRITALQSIYPALHYAILVVLALAECIAYLIETDQELLVFLNAVQIKLLWSMLVGTFVACFAVVMDLRTPFSGSYQISASVDQLLTIKLTLQASSVLAAQKKQQQELADSKNGHESTLGDRSDAPPVGFVVNGSMKAGSNESLLD
jgi:K+-sensing histidine kinase KdpD